MPKVFLVGTGLILLPSGIARIWTMDNAPWAINKFITTIDIYAFGLLTVFWTALFTVGVGAFTVMVMKGPAYVADAYPLPDADKPDHHQRGTTRYALGTNVKPIDVDTETEQRNQNR